MGTRPKRARPRLLWIGYNCRGRAASRQREREGTVESSERAAARAHEGEPIIEVLSKKRPSETRDEGVWIRGYGNWEGISKGQLARLALQTAGVFGNGEMDDLYNNQGCASSTYSPKPNTTRKTTLRRREQMVAESCIALVQANPQYSRIYSCFTVLASNQHAVQNHVDLFSPHLHSFHTALKQPCPSITARRCEDPATPVSVIVLSSFLPSFLSFGLSRRYPRLSCYILRCGWGSIYPYLANNPDTFSTFVNFSLAQIKNTFRFITAAAAGGYLFTMIGSRQQNSRDADIHTLRLAMLA